MGQELSDLTELLRAALAEYGYTEVVDGPAADIPFVARITTPPHKKPQYVCAIIAMPPQMDGIEPCKQFLERVRTFLADQAPSASWKGCGTYLVLFCSSH